MREKVIELLNTAVADELTAVHQYMFFHFHLDDQGFGKLAGLFKRTAIEEMMHVEKLAERILFLKGEVIMRAEEVETIHDPKAMLQKAQAMEASSVRDYNQAAIACGQYADAMSKQIFEGLVGDEERHGDQYERQIDFINQFGDKYMALQSMEASEDGA